MRSTRLNRFLKTKLQSPTTNHLFLATTILFVVALIGTACGGRAEFKGTVLQDQQPAPGFQLTDQNGKAVSLADLRGDVIVLTFLYTSCPDICPFITQQLRQFQEKLGPAAQEVVVVAITVDPETDTVERIRLYSEVMGLGEQWHYLTGRREELDPVWKAYHVAPLSEQSAQELATTPDLAKSDPRFAGLHTAPLYLIDRQGMWRLHYSGGDLSIEDLLHDVQLLLKEG